MNERGAKTVSVRRGSTANERRTVCVTVAADGSKLPLFVIFKGTAYALSCQMACMVAHRRKGGWIIELWKYGRRKYGNRTWRLHKNSALLLDRM